MSKKISILYRLMILAVLAICATAARSQTLNDHIDDALFAEALKSFHKLANTTDIGVTLADYRRLVVDAKTAFDVPIAKFPQGVQRRELEAAMQDYVIAVDVWGISLDNIRWCDARSQPVGLPMKTDFYRSLRARIGEDILPAPKANVCAKRDAMLKIVWLSAARHITRAMDAQKQP